MSVETALPHPHDHRHGSSVGQPLTRRDGILKVTGRATYAADNHPDGMLYAVGGGQPDRTRSCAGARRQSRQGASRCCRGCDACKSAAARA